MVTSWLGFTICYALICAVPALVLLVRGRGWRPRIFLLTLLLGWTGGGWMIMLWLAVVERSANFNRTTPLPPPERMAAKRARPDPPSR